MRTGIACALAASLSFSTPLLAQVSECDRLAAHPEDQTRPAGVPGVDRKKLQAAAAIDACSRALAERPDDPRLKLQLARAFDVDGTQLQRAAKLNQEAAEAGHLVAMFDWGNALLDGWGVSRNDREAALWFRRAAEAGHAKAMTMVGYVIAHGRGTLRNDGDAAQWYRRAAEAGEPMGMANYAKRLAKGLGVPRNDQESTLWYRRSAEGGAASGMNGLGQMLAEGRGIHRNDQEAVTWYRRAAELGNPQAMTNLGYMLALGRGVPKNGDESLYWYKKAAAAGEPGAREYLADLGAASQRGSRGTTGRRQDADDSPRVPYMSTNPNGGYHIGNGVYVHQ